MEGNQTGYEIEHDENDGAARLAVYPAAIAEGDKTEHGQTHKFLVVVEDNFGSTPWEQTFEFNGKDNGDDDGGKIIGPIVGPVTPVIR